MAYQYADSVNTNDFTALYDFAQQALDPAEQYAGYGSLYSPASSSFVDPSDLQVEIELSGFDNGLPGSQGLGDYPNLDPSQDYDQLDNFPLQLSQDELDTLKAYEPSWSPFLEPMGGGGVVNTLAPQVNPSPSPPTVGHTGKAEFKCDFEGCNKAYTAKQSLKTHKRNTHQSLQPHRCYKGDCNGRSMGNDPSNIRRHERIFHKDNTKVRCPHCTYETSRPDNLPRHVRTCRKRVQQN